MLVFSLIGLVACQSKNKVFLKIEHQLINKPSTSIKYTIQKNEVEVIITDKQIPFGKKEYSYSKSLDKEEINALENFLISQRLDTLQKAYNQLPEYGSYLTTVSFAYANKPITICKLNSTNLPIIDSLHNYIDDLIDNSKFKFGKQNY